MFDLGLHARTGAVGAALLTAATTAVLGAGLVAAPAAAAATAAPGNHYFLSNADATTTPTADAVFAFGGASDVVLTGDWDGNGTTTLAVRRGNTYIQSVATGSTATTTVAFGSAKDVVISGDWDGDRSDSLGVRRGNVFHTTSRGTTTTFAFGGAADQVLVGDWDGNGTDTVALRRGNAYFVTAVNGGPVTSTFRFGVAADVVVVGDWDGDGRDSLAVRRKNAYLQTATTPGAVVRTVTFGGAADTVLLGDWDGDGTDTLGLRRPRLVVPGEGTFQVGSQARPGTYRAAIAPGASECWWDAYDTVEHDLAEPVAGDFISAADREASIYAEVRPGDVLFATSGCTTWALVTALDVPAPRALSDGRWRVGKDVLPGTYTVDVPADSGCVWARTRDFRWAEGSLLEGMREDGAAHRATVTVSPGDAGVASVGCGTWTRQS